jgi:hypothetical protein
MTRGRVWGYYHSDTGNIFALEVDGDYFGMTERGWTVPAAPGTIPFPRGWTPRKAYGLDERGAIQFAIVASVSADLWTGVATTFTINGSDELPHTCTVFKRKAERNQVKP